MGENRPTLAASLLCAFAAGAAVLIGCNRFANQDNGTGIGAANIVVRTDLSIADVSSVKLTVQSPSVLPTPLSVPLALKGGQYSAQVNSLAIASDYVFIADAKKSDGTSIFHGADSNVTISKGNTAQVTIYLSQINPVGFTNSAPVIDTVSFDANQVAQGGTVHLSATAHDPDPGQTATLTFAWTSTCGAVIVAAAPSGGSDTSPRSDTAVFTAPNADVDCQVNLTVTDAPGQPNKAAFSIRVGLGSTGDGSAKVSAIVDGAPVIASLTANPAQIAVGPVGGTLTVVATDPEGDPLNYQWSSTTAGCTAFLGTPTAPSTSYVVSAVSVPFCTFTITVNDGTWPGTTIVKNTVVSSLTLPVGSPAVASPPLFGLAYQSDDTVTGGESIALAVVAGDPAGGTLTYNWSVKSGSTGSVAISTPVTHGLDPVFTAVGTWTAPAGAENGLAAVVISVTATSSKSGFTAEFDFTLIPANNHCLTATDGTTCTIPGNLCVTSATCQNHVCTAVTTKTCAASTNSCADNICFPATGTCSAANKPVGTTCNDNQGCTTGDVCDGNGTCAGAPVVCTQPTNTCQIATCLAGADNNSFTCPVANAANGKTCDDGIPCTTGDVCTNGTCAGTALCAPPLGCLVTNGTPSCVAPACMGASYAQMWTPTFVGMANGADGTLWSTGNIFSPFNFGSGSVTSTGGADIYLTKLDPATGLAVLTETFGQTSTANSNNQTATGVAVASSGAVGLIGTFTGEIDFTSKDSVHGGASGVDYLQNSSATNFWAVFNSAGTPVKSHMIDVGTGAIVAIGSNPGQNAVAICGRTSKLVPASTTALGLLTGSNVYGGGMDIVVAKIDSTGVLWGKQLGGAGDQLCQSVALDNNGNVVIAGGYNGTLSTFPVVSDPTASLPFVATLSGTTGAPIAGKTWGTSGVAIPYGLTVDASGNVIVAGSSSVGSGVDGGASVMGAFVVKLNSSLTLVWTQSFGDGTSTQQAKSVAASSNGDVYLAGSFVGTMGPNANLTSFSSSNTDAFVGHLAAADGSVLCAHVYGDAAAGQAASAITVARTATGALVDSVAIGGQFASTMTFGSTVLNTGSPSVIDSYVARLSP